MERGNRFHQNGFSKLGADAKPGIADQANEVALAAQKLDLLLFAKTHLTKTMGNLGRSGKLLDADGCAGNDPAQRAQEWFFAATTFT